MNDINHARLPTHRLFNVRGEGENSHWTEIGAAWPNRDGQGYTLSLDALPLGGRLVMREIVAGSDAV